jgi:DNA-binding Lrp family transcriptional regulator
MNSIQKEIKITIKDISKRLNISEQTYHNWKKEKPELIKLIKMGLDMEKLINKYN